jgi:MFS family permease
MVAWRGYGALWRVPGAPVLLVFGLLGRLGISVEPLGLILLVQQATGRYAAAALGGAVYTLGYAAAQPVAGRLAGRRLGAIGDHARQAGPQLTQHGPVAILGACPGARLRQAQLISRPSACSRCSRASRTARLNSA